MGKLWGLFLGAALLAAPATARAHQKRTDRCGCHHQYGLRHCHPNKKTQSCEAPVQGKAKVKPPPPTRPVVRA